MKIMYQAKTLDDIRAFMETLGVPGRDGHGLPSSPLRFADGGHFRVEVAGVERLSTLEALLEEADKLAVPVHRVIAAVGGSTYVTMDELAAMAGLARRSGVEAILTVGQRRAWDAGAREQATPEGAMQGYRLRGSDQVAYHIADLMRGAEAGFRGFLVYDEGVLRILAAMRREGLLPPETVFKFSVFGGYASPAGAVVLKDLGADTMNPAADVSLPILAAIRQAVEMPLDVYVSVVDSMGGMFRAHEATEMARVAAPCYLKLEPGPSEGEMYKPWVSEAWHADLARHKARMAAVVLELMARHAPELVCSPMAAD